MLSVTFSVGSPLAYRVRSLELPGLVHQIQADLEDGTHTFTSRDFKLGTVHSLGRRALIGLLSFRYTYDAKNQTITVCSTDFSSADGMTLVTMPEGTDYACIEHAGPGGFTADETSGPWNYRTQLMPGAADVFGGVVRGASDALIAALKATPDLTVQLRTPFPELPMEHYLNLCVVYRRGRFLELFDQSREYEDGDEVHPFESVYGGTATFPVGAPFANVIGSTHDPKIKPYTSWVALWEAKVGVMPTKCESFDYDGFKCGNDVLGGHVVKGVLAERVPAGSDDVFIFPICSKHNKNDKVHMAALTYRTAVKLNNYMGSD